MGGKPQAQPEPTSVAQVSNDPDSTRPTHALGDLLKPASMTAMVPALLPGHITDNAVLMIAHPGDSEVAADGTDRLVSSPSAQAQQQGVERSEPGGQRVPLVPHRLEDRAEAPTTGHRASRGSSTCRPAGDPIARYVRVRNVCARVQPS